MNGTIKLVIGGTGHVTQPQEKNELKTPASNPEHTGEGMTAAPVTSPENSIGTQSALRPHDS